MPARRASWTEAIDGLPSVHLDPAPRRHGAIEGAEEFAPPGAEQSGDAENLAGAKLEADVMDAEVESDALRHREALDLEERRRADRGVVVGIEALHALARHRGDDALLVEVGAIERRDDATVAQHRRPVAEREHLRQAMGDEDHGRAPTP